MVIQAFRSKAKDDLQRLARDIADAQRGAVTQPALRALHRRFRDVQDAAAEHTQLLATGINDTAAALQLVRAQLGSLLARAG